MTEHHLYSCLEDFCHETWETYRPAAVCPMCGSPEIEIDHTEVDDYDDFSGR